VSDILTKNRVHGIVSDHRAFWHSRQDEVGLANALFTTRFWPWWLGWGRRTFGNRWKNVLTGDEIEDNRLQREVLTYNAALDQPDLRFNVKPDPSGKGDPKVKTAVANAWVAQSEIAEVGRNMREMALMYPGAGAKIRTEAGEGNPLYRTILEAIPPWELVQDRDVTNRRQARYRGHLYSAPRDYIEGKYGAALFDRGVVKLTGHQRANYLADGFNATGTSNLEHPGGETEQSPDTDFVTVLELCNLVDSVEVGGRLYKGRLEIWLIDQAAAVSDCPIAVTPLPFSPADGRPGAHIFPLSFLNELGYPLKAMAPMARFYPLAVARNILLRRTMMDIRRNARKAIAREGAFSQDQWDNLLDEQDMNVATTKNVDKPLADLWMAVPAQPIPADTMNMMANLDGMQTRQAGPSANAQGVVTNATAYETQNTQLFTEALFKLHIGITNELWRQVVECAIRAVLVCMTDTSDSEGGRLDKDEALAPVGVVGEEGAMAATDGPTTAQEQVAASIPAKGWATFTVEDNGEAYEVTPESLDGTTDVVFTEAETTPITNAGLLQWLTGQGLQQYMGLLAVVFKGGPEGAVAEAVMDQIAIRAQLPKSLHVGELKRRAAEAAPAPEAAAPDEKETPPEGANPPPPAEPATSPAPPKAGPSATVDGILQQALGALGAVASQGPDMKAAVIDAGRAVRAALDAFAAGDGDAFASSLIAARQALSAVQVDDPNVDVARKAVATLIRAMASGTLPGVQSPEAMRPPPEEPPPGDVPGGAV